MRYELGTAQNESEGLESEMLSVLIDGMAKTR